MSGLAQVNSAGQPQATAPITQLTVVQMNRLIKAMGRDAFRGWFEHYRHGRRQETVEELMNVLDTIGEDLFRQYYFAESAPLVANSTPAVALLGTGGVSTANQLALQLQVLPPEPVTNHTLLNNESSAGGNELSQPALPSTSLVAANSTPPNIAPPAGPTPLLDLSQIRDLHGRPLPIELVQLAAVSQSAFPTSAVNSTPLNIAPPAVPTPLLDLVAIRDLHGRPLPIELLQQQLTGGGLYSSSLVESRWTNAEVVVGPDGLRTVVQLPLAAQSPAVDQQAATDAQPALPIPPEAAALPSTPPAVVPTKCEKCGDKCGGKVPGDYKSRRAHVVEKHGLVEEATELATQEALKKSVGECFPDSVVRNDLMCNHPGCGKEVALYKGWTGCQLQHSHVQQFHLAAVAEDICPLSCPVRGCDKWRGVRRDFRSLRHHIRMVHKGMESMTEEDKAACRQLLDRLEAATENALSHFFPHTPIGVLCRGADAVWRNAPRAARVETRLTCISADEPETIRIEESESACSECGEPSLPCTLPAASTPSRSTWRVGSCPPGRCWSSRTRCRWCCDCASLMPSS